jgi:hypothetical protein
MGVEASTQLTTAILSPPPGVYSDARKRGPVEK